MAEEDRKFAKHIMGKTVVTKSGKKFGEVSDIRFDSRTGELMQIILRVPTAYSQSLELEQDNYGNFLIPYSAVIAVGDYVVVEESDIL